MKKNDSDEFKGCHIFQNKKFKTSVQKNPDITRYKNTRAEACVMRKIN